MGLTHLHSPAHSHIVRGSSGEFREGRDIHRAGGSAGVLASLLGGDRVGEGTELVIHLDGDGGGEVVFLLTGSLQQGEPDNMK